MKLKMQERNIANIFVADKPANVRTRNDGVLVGYNFEGFIFVVVDVVPLEKVSSLDQLGDILTEDKFRAFSWSCAGDLTVLGVLETKGTTQISTSSAVQEFKSNQSIWLNIMQDPQDGKLTLKDLIICEYKYTQVIPNFIVYPRLSDGQILSTGSVGFG